MNAVLTPHDWQLISEYLDGKIRPDQRAYVEKQMAASEEWLDAYETMRNTRRALHMAPRRRAPRNFSLTAAQAAAIRKPSRSIVFFRWSSAFSTGLAAVFVALGFVFSSSAPATLMAQDTAAMPESAPAPVESEMTAADASAATAIPIIIWGSPEMNPYLYAGRGGGMGGGGGGDAAMDSSEVASAPVEKSAGDPGAVTAMGSEPQNTFSMESLPEEAAPTERLMLGAEPFTGSGPILGVQSTESGDDSVSVTEQMPDTRAIEPAPAQPDQKPWYWLAGAMGTFAVGSAVLGWKKR